MLKSRFEQLRYTQRAILRSSVVLLHESNVPKLFSTICSRLQVADQQTEVKFTLSDIKVVRRSRNKESASGRQSIAATRGIEVGKVNVLQEMDNRGGRTNFYQFIKDVIDKFSNRIDGEYVVLIQVGSFYELYYDQVEKYAALLGLKATQKQTKEGAIPFSGFPDYALNKYLPLILERGLKTVICKQVENPITGSITRPVDRLITPGTVIDEVLRNYHKNNFVMALSFPDDLLKDPEGKKIGIAWCDVNLGIFSYVETPFNELLPAITRIDPSEIIISSKVNIEDLLSGRWFFEFVDLKRYYITKFNMPSIRKPFESFLDKFSDNEKLVKSTWDKFTIKEKSASMLLLQFLDFSIPNHKPAFNLPTKDLPKSIMKIDARAAQDLELIQTLQTRNRVGALAHILDKTVTNPGARLLHAWLLAPSTELKEIIPRQDLVESFLNNLGFVNDMTATLKKTCDCNRILKRIDNNNCDFFEYLELGKTIDSLRKLAKSAKVSQDPILSERLELVFGKFKKSRKLHTLSKDLIQTIDANLTFNKSESNNDDSTIRRSWSIQKTASGELSCLRNEYDKLVEEYREMVNSYIQGFRDKGYNGSIKFVKDAKTWEYVVEIKSQSKVLPEIIKNLQLTVIEKSKSNTKVKNEKWTLVGNKLYQLEQRIVSAENEILKKFENRIQNMYKELRLVSPVIEYLDVIQSFTQLALEKNFKRPVLDKSNNFIIKNGRHVVVEDGLRNSHKIEPFIANDCQITSAYSWIITGPNMGGKSTFLRQNAIIAILAQIGSFVPAEEAHIGVIDKIFTRVGSSDNIFKNQSTFMVEMNETAVILREATSRSLVIVDELGRGTAINEGIAIAYSALVQLLNKNKAKVLFATHFGPELHELIQKSDKIKEKVDFYRTELTKVDDTGDKDGLLKPIDQRIKFTHRLYHGISDYSHALDIADLAGFPKETLNLAKKTVNSLLKINIKV